MGKSSSSDLRVRMVGEIERGQSYRAAVRGCAGDGGSTGAGQGGDGIGGTVTAGAAAGQWSACCAY